MTGMTVTMSIKNRKALKRIEDLKDANVAGALLEVNGEYAPAVLETIKKNASGRPGPEVITGNYRNSIVIADITEDRMAFRSDHPAAARLEYGYVGRDSLGRMVDAPPYPHFRPALQLWARSWSRALLRRAAAIPVKGK
jgi:hypothetical protein